MISKILKSNGVRQILGGVAGMTVAAALYFGMNALPISKALLISGNPTVVQNGKQVNIADKNVDPDTLNRIAARAQQVAAALHADASSSAMSVASAEPAQSAVVDHADRSAWLAMRATQRALNEMHAAASSSQIVVIASSAQMTEPTPAPTVNYQAPAVVDTTAMPTVPSKRLPNSGLGLNLLMLASFAFALWRMPEERKRALIAALRFGY